MTPAGQIARSVTAFDPADRATAWSVGGLASGRTFDPAGRIETQSGPGLSGTALYTYDETTGRKVSESLPLAYPGAEQSTYDYNDVGRLTFATIGGTETRYAYQPGSGNLVEVRRGSETTTTLSYDSANRLTSMSGPSGTTTYGWDTARGWRTQARRSGETTVTYTYDDAGRMRTLTDPNTATAASYTYDARGMRTHALVVRGSVTTTYTYSYDGLALLGYSAAASDGTTESVTYLYDADSRAYAGVYAASGIAPVAFGILTTDRGDVRALTDGSGETFAAYGYDAYGLPTAKPSRGTGAIDATLAARIADANVLRYAGYCYDEHSGLYYLAARYYDPASCQFLTKDPAKADGEESAYQYCGGDPVGKVDPTGRWSIPSRMTTLRYYWYVRVGVSPRLYSIYKFSIYNDGFGDFEACGQNPYVYRLRTAVVALTAAFACLAGYSGSELLLAVYGTPKITGGIRAALRQVAVSILGNQVAQLIDSNRMFTVKDQLIVRCRSLAKSAYYWERAQSGHLKWMGGGSLRYATGHVRG